MDLRHATAVALLVTAGTLPAAEKPKAAKPVDVYLLGGQSNMQGTGKVADLPADVKKEVPHTFFWNGKTFEPLVLGKTNTAGRVTTFGPEVDFALDTATADRPIYLIKYHASGMPLHQGSTRASGWAETPPPAAAPSTPARRPTTPTPAPSTPRW